MTRPSWKSRMGFLLVVIGSAVGLGNIWRFPYVAYKNGGGAFLIPYFIALLLVAIPLLILEHGLGHMKKGSAPLAYARIRQGWEYLGWWVSIFLTFGLLLYYSAVLSWCINYLIFSFTQAWGVNPGAFFAEEFLQQSSAALKLGGIRTPILLGVAGIWGLNWFVVSRGIRRGIELANKIAMPALFVMLIVLLVWSLMLPGASEGVKAFITPDLSQLWNRQVWSDAFGQVFFTLSLGSGIMIVYASYLPKKTNLSGNAIITASANSAIEIISGFAVFAIIGYMAFVVGKPIADAVTGGPGLAFVAYPKAISQLPFGNALFGVIFFLSLLLAGLSSSISMLETFISAAIDKFGWARKKLVTIVSAIGFFGSIIFATDAGVLWLDIIDHMVCNVGMLLTGLFEVLLVAWIFGAEKFAKHLDDHSSLKLGKAWVFCAKFIIPLVLSLMFGASLWKDISQPYGGSWDAFFLIGLGWLAATLVAAKFFAQAKWTSKHLTHPARGDDESLVIEVK